MNKYISVKRAICICLILSCLMMCLNIYMKAYDRSNRKENLYFDALKKIYATNGYYALIKYSDWMPDWYEKHQEQI